MESPGSYPDRDCRTTVNGRPVWPQNKHFQSYVHSGAMRQESKSIRYYANISVFFNLTKARYSVERLAMVAILKDFGVPHQQTDP